MLHSGSMTTEIAWFMNAIKHNDVKFYKTPFFLIETSHYFGDVFVLIINDLNEV